jgi:hypothetical protein
VNAWKQIGALLIRTITSTVLLSLLMYAFFACIDSETFIAVAELAKADPVGTTWSFVPIVIMLCLSVMLCYLVVTPPKCSVCVGKTKVVVEEKKPVAKKAPAKKVTKTTKKVTKK